MMKQINRHSRPPVPPMFEGMSRQSLPPMLAGMASNQRSRQSLPPMLVRGASDSDRDGVIDPWDCQPFNPNKQGVLHDAKERVVAEIKTQAQAAKERVVAEIETQARAAKERAFAEIETQAAAAKKKTIAKIKRAPSYAGTVIDRMWGDPDYNETIMQEWGEATGATRRARAQARAEARTPEPSNGATVSAQRRARTTAARKPAQTPQDVLLAVPPWL